MFLILGKMGVLVLIGILWRIIKPDGLDADHTRRVLASVVFNLLLPALVFLTLMSQDLGVDSLKMMAFGFGIILFGIILGLVMGKTFKIPPAKLGGVVLGVGFANITYLGLPLLEHLYGPMARAIIVHLDIFASLPMVLTLGLMIARHYGESVPSDRPPLKPLLLNPPLLSAGLAGALKSASIELPSSVQTFLEPLAEAVAPLMLITLGLSLNGRAMHWHQVPLGLAVMIAKLVIAPLFGLWLGWNLGFRGDLLTALVLESAMPSMIFGVVYCDRYRLDGSFYAFIVLLTTLGAILTLPLWLKAVTDLPHLLTLYSMP